LGLDVMAEGVETEVQHEFLNLRGCRAFQGFLFGKPVQIDQFELSLGVVNVVGKRGIGGV
jgi:EAL domain-containing protein (putative c-di-GMP-specific phosphodiesterase class I)